ncbi:hypothetical protein [Planktothricoides raciborskii]|uniref:Uncharacterized protein n=1 Tax=Planktothricoides raciborskii GIHE-MW2 TaxID=2792601 RepID=A0AAU8JM52_9CYAN
MKSVVGQLASPLFISDIEAETMKTIFTSPILVVIILLVESISTVSLAANSQLSQKAAVTLTDSEIIANQDGDRTSESDQCKEQIDCGKIQSTRLVL